MTRYIRGGIAALLLLLSPAPASAQMSGFSEADAKELASYRLTMETVKKVQAATTAMIEGMREDPRFKRYQEIEAELEALDKKEVPTDADLARMEALEKEREELQNVSPLNLDSAESLDGMEASVTRSPVLSKALAEVGLAPREYVKFLMAMIQTSIAVGFKKAGMLKELPPGVTPENVAFIEANEAELRAMQAEFQRLLAR